MESRGEIVIYKTEDGKSELQVHFKGETLWMSLSQIAQLFERDKSVISRHINNIYYDDELQKEPTVAFFATVQREGKREIIRQLEYFNLDLILSVGYRVNSKRGTQFRIWATQTLKNHLVKGYTINEQRLREQEKKFKELHQTVEFLKNTIGYNQLNKAETTGILEIISQYTRSFVLLNQFDSNKLSPDPSGRALSYEISYDEATAAIEELKKQLIQKKEASELFGRQRDEGFPSILQSILQTFDGKHVYPTIEQQAAHLLYFVIKNHPFADGNKRIGAFFFVWFLHLNKHLLRKKNELKINDNALVALALLVAQSDPANKHLMINLIINLINEQ